MNLNTISLSMQMQETDVSQSQSTPPHLANHQPNHTSSTTSINTTHEHENNIQVSSSSPVVSIRKDYISVSRGGGPRRPPNVKVRRKCLEVIFQPSVIYLTVTLLLTGVASALLSIGLTSKYWEVLMYNNEELNRLVSVNNNSRYNLTWFFNGSIPRITDLDSPIPHTQIYLLPLHSGVWISCLDISEGEFEELRSMGYEYDVHCVDHLIELEENRKIQGNTRGSWQHRMQNLAIACSMVSLILLGAAIVLGLFGLLRCQVSAVLVTGVIYYLASTFSVFTLSIFLLKHKNRQDSDSLEVWLRLTPEYEEFRSARIISFGYSIQLASGGTLICLIASTLWILLAKMMRYTYTYNPFPIIT